jgi:hypothetical protein
VKNRFHLTHKQHLQQQSSIKLDPPRLTKKRRTTPSLAAPTDPVPYYSPSSFTFPSQLPRGDSLTSLLVATSFDLDNHKKYPGLPVVNKDMVVSALDVKLAFDNGGMAMLVKLDRPVLCVAPRAQVFPDGV